MSHPQTEETVTNLIELYETLLMPALREIDWNKHRGKTAILAIRPGGKACRKLAELGFHVSGDKMEAFVCEPWRACGLASNLARARWFLRYDFEPHERAVFIVGDEIARVVIYRQPNGEVSICRGFRFEAL